VWEWKWMVVCVGVMMRWRASRGIPVVLLGGEVVVVMWYGRLGRFVCGCA
jgi:hypothetical protein